ncbi:MAG: Gfo/Idh/MocA family oxidoreductase [Saprospiraceae bacterium]|nr:Gfo/Idh/MocA family oxidoreductase [Saprospiraceae bacterium]MCB9311555.1 Gfo/Idh/MocA family oxidoreductase [Lewinellaceae bacterium]HRW76211.1 Gfo/Idh/MocA family oxidoreductase [Saprospiraceae bacterium]
MMKLAIIGYGYWGPNLTRNFHNTPDCQVKWVLDLSEKQRLRVRSTYPNIHTTDRIEDVIHDHEVDAVVIATPVYTHFDLASRALKAGKHVLLEKPMTSTKDEAVALIELARKHDRVLMVDHTYLYTPAVQRMKQYVDEGLLGHIRYVDSTRINLGLFQTDVNVLWDLAPHDISICRHLLGERPISVQAVGVSHTENNLENIAFLTLFYPENRIAHFNCSWISPVKIRQMLVGGDEKMLVFNDLETTEKLRIYDKGYSVLPESDRDRILVDYRTGDIMIPKIPQFEALAELAKDFRDAVLHGKEPVSDYLSGLEVVEILEAADQSIKQKGREILL